jgi:hypothetical protein
MILFRLLFLFTTLWQISLSQESTIKDIFLQNVFTEDFNEENKHFSTESSNDNFFGIVNGDYFLNRSTNSPYSIMSNWKNDLEDFEFRSSIKISPDKNNTAQSVGIILKYNPDTQEGLIFEINSNKKYRLRHINQGKNKYLTSGKDGWIKTYNLNRNDIKNEITIKTKNNKYEFFINNNLELKKNLTNTAKKGLNSGNFGIYLSGLTKVRIDYIYILALKSYNGINKSLDLSKEEIKKIITENLDLKNKIKTNNNHKITELNNIVDFLKEQLKETNHLNDSLTKENNQYSSYKHIIDDNENFLYTLTKDLKEQIEKNHALKNQKIILKDSIESLINNQELFKLQYLKILDSLIEKEQKSDTIK